MGANTSHWGFPTVSLVRASEQNIKRALKNFNRDIKGVAKKTNKSALTTVLAALCFWAFVDGTNDNDGYISNKYIDFYLLRTVDVSYCRSQNTMLLQEKLHLSLIRLFLI